MQLIAWASLTCIGSVGSGCLCTHPLLWLRMRLYSHLLAALLACLLCCHSAASLASPPSCATVKTELQASHIQACRSFVSLLEDQSFCSLDQTQQCCTVLNAAIATRCHCWQGFPTATVTLLDLLHQHCSHNTTSATNESSTGSLALTIFFGVLTGSANFEQRQAGTAAQLL